MIGMWPSGAGRASALWVGPDLDPTEAATVGALVETFPGSGVITDDDPAGDVARRAWAAWYCQAVWGSGPGFACLWLGHGGDYDERGKYAFTGQDQRFYVWPRDGEHLVDDAMGAAENVDVYVAPQLRASRSRKKGTGAPGRFLWVDLDGEWTAERSDRLKSVLGPGSFVVLSGSGRHAYVALVVDQPPTTVEELNRRLAAYLDGDAKWEGTSLLRLPGVERHAG